MTLRCPPAHEHVPEHAGTYGDEVADLGETVGLHLDPEQRLVIDAMYAHDERGRFASSEVGVCAPRQNVKSHVGKIASLADLVLFEDPNSLWTAHLRATSDATFAELRDVFENYDHLRRLVAPGGIKDSDGEQSITLRPSDVRQPPPKLTFMARSERGGRGLSGNRVTFDEALFLKPQMLGAMVPILSARSLAGDVQVRYLGSAGLQASASWRQVRDQGREGSARKLAWLEWAAPLTPCEQEPCTHAPDTPGCALDRPDLIRAANLALDRRIGLDFVLGVERLRLEPVDFMRERLGWWDDPPNLSGGDLDAKRWATLVDVDAEPSPRGMVFGVDQGEDRTVSIGCAWRRPDRDVQVMLAQGEQVDAGLPPARAIVRLQQLQQRWGGVVLLGGPAVGLDRDLQRLQVRTQLVSSAEFATACGHLDDRLRAGTVHHGGQDALTVSVAAVRWRSVGTAGERAFQLRDAPLAGPAAAVVRALHGLTAARPQAPPQIATPSISTPGAVETDLAHMGF